MLKKLIISAVASGLLATAAQGQGVTLTALVLQEKTVEEAGVKRVVLVPAGTIIPGQEVIYNLSYANGGAKPAEQVVLTNPVPATLEYMSGDNALVSVDGGKTFALLTALKVCRCRRHSALSGAQRRNSRALEPRRDRPGRKWPRAFQGAPKIAGSPDRLPIASGPSPPSTIPISKAG